MQVTSEGLAQIKAEALSAIEPARMSALMERSEGDIASLEGYVRPLLEMVRTRGDSAVRELTLRFDKVDLRDMPLRVQPAEFDEAEKALPADLLAALDLAISNIRAGHVIQLGESLVQTEVVPGVIVGERFTPLAAAGLYVPRGKGSFPSVAMMLAVPAVVAGVRRPVIVTPPGADGRVDAATLAVARRVGVDEVYRVGGVQAVAALAYGTESIPRVPKVIGPGNAYVAAAKRALTGVIDPGVPAGPSESIVYADGTVDALTAAYDLLVEAEHGADSCAILVTPSRAFAEAVAEELPGLIEALPEPRRSFVLANFASRSCVLWSDDESAAIDFINAFAPEHLLILCENPQPVFARIENAGEVLLGPHAAITLGNYCAGNNAVLPTGGLARMTSCLGVPDFQKRMAFLSITRPGLEALSESAIVLADYEGFPAHAAAVRHRVQTD